MSKTIYIISGLLSILILGVFTIVFLKKTDTPLTGLNQQPVEYTSGFTSTYSSTTAVFPTNNGQESTENFLLDSTVTADEYNENYYFLGNTFTDQTQPGGVFYVITYQSDTGYFNITLLKKPFGIALFEAENYLKDLLKVDEETLCSFKYSVTVPSYVDDFAAGTDYRFSFCEDSINPPTS